MSKTAVGFARAPPISALVEAVDPSTSFALCVFDQQVQRFNIERVCPSHRLENIERWNAPHPSCSCCSGCTFIVDRPSLCGNDAIEEFGEYSFGFGS